MPCSETNQNQWYKKHLQKYESMLKGWLRSKYQNQIDVDDLVQEALLKVLAAKRRAEVKSPKAFFFAVARNLAIDHIRKQRVVCNESLTGKEALELLDEAESVEERVSKNHELEILTEAIQSLPERCRRVFTLNKVYGMTYNEIAKEMGISFNTVSAQISIGLSRCTDYMRRHGRD